MWKSPKCECKCDELDQKHRCVKPSEAVDAYIEAQAEDIQLVLNQVRETLGNALPGTQERIAYGIPTFWDEGNIIHFAGNKKHVGLYPGDKAIEHFTSQLEGYTLSKGTVRFPYSKPLPLTLIADIAKWSYERQKHH